MYYSQPNAPRRLNPQGENMNNPKIGIRPTIDGRRKGVRESLEVQTMNMAKAAVQRNKLNNIVPRADT